MKINWYYLMKRPEKPTTLDTKLQNMPEKHAEKCEKKL